MNASRLAVAARSAILALALGGFAWRALSTAAVYNHTFDEPTQIASGLELVQHHRFELHLDAPPLAKVLMAAPLHLAGVRMDRVPGRGNFAEATTFLYEKTPYWSALRSARAMSTLVGMLLLLAIYAAAQQRFGSAGASVAVVVASVSPGLVSAASIANSDILGVVTLLLALHAWRRLLERGGPRQAALFALSVALSVLAKLSALPFLAFTLPVVALWILGRRVLDPVRHPLVWTRSHGRELAVIAALVPLAIWAGYGFQLAPPIGELQAGEMAARLRPRFPALADAVGGLAALEAPLGAFLRGMGAASKIAKAGHPAYLMGDYSLHGWPHYFLVTLALKVPIGILAAVALATILAVRSRRSTEGREVLLQLTIAAAILASVARAGINAGHRHVIAVEAIFALVAGGGAALAWRESGLWHRASAGLLAAAVTAGAVSSARAHPDALGYTNAFAGSRPDWWFVDSNLDWGQDLARLARWLEEHGIGEEVRLGYFGTALPARHGLRSRALEPGERATGWIAASVHLQRGLGGAGVGLLPTAEQRKAYAWLLRLKEVARIGTSIRVYRVTPRDLAMLATSE